MASDVVQPGNRIAGKVVELSDDHSPRWRLRPNAQTGSGMLAEPL